MLALKDKTNARVEDQDFMKPIRHKAGTSGKRWWVNLSKKDAKASGCIDLLEGFNANNGVSKQRRDLATGRKSGKTIC